MTMDDEWSEATGGSSVHPLDVRCNDEKTRHMERLGKINFLVPSSEQRPAF